MRPSLFLPEFANRFTARAAEMLGARGAILALAAGSPSETTFLHDPAASADPALLQRLNGALNDLAAARSDNVFFGSAAALLGPGLAGAFGWRDLALAQLTGSQGERLGVLGLADRSRKLTPADANLLRTLAGHASVTLENARLFSRIEQAKKEWVEIFDAISDWIVVHGPDSRVLRVNRSLANFLGRNPAELIGVPLCMLVPVPGAARAASCPFCRVGHPSTEEFACVVQERTYLVSTSRIRGDLDESLRTIHVLKDITAHREAERRYRELFDNIQEGLFFTTPEGHFLEVNDALVRMLGYPSREELLQVNLFQLFLLAEQRQRFREALERHGVLRNYEESLRRKDGSIIHVLQNIFGVRDAHGRVAQYRGLMLDVTEQKTFQAQLQRERDFNRKILNNTQSMILVLDTAGLVSYANRRCFEAGYREEDLLGHPLIEFVAPARRPSLVEALQQALRGLQTDNLELPLLRRDAKAGQFSVNLSPMRDEQNAVSSIVVVMTDITDAAVLQAKLIHAEKMAAVGQLVSGVAHEVNNPLAAIVGFTDLLLANPEIPQPAKNDLGLILQEAERTKGIVQNLLSFARQMPARRKPVQINTILRETLQLRSYDFSSHGVDVVERFEESLPEVIGDTPQLKQVFLNILNNAYDAVGETRRRGRIEIETSARGAFVEIFFRDNGTGIAYPDRIFDPFFTTKEVGKGTGLGLSICYGILRELGGEIFGYNNAGADGSTFLVRLPVAAAAVLEAAGGANP